MISLFEIAGLFPNILQEGFSAYKSTLATSTDTIITNWSVASPSFSSSHFDATTGIFTVPATGVYAIQSTISYITNSAISSQLGAGIYPFFTVRKISPTVSDLVIGQLPVFDTSLALLTLRTVLAGGTVTLSNVIELTKDDTLGLYYDADNMTVALTLQEIQWTFYRLN